MHLDLKSLDIVLDLYMNPLLFVKLVFRAKLYCVCFYTHLPFFFIQAEFIILFSTASKYLVTDTFTYTYRC